jgi:hypothetical protein
VATELSQFISMLRPFGTSVVVTTLVMRTTPRRFLPPWSVEEWDACYVVPDHNGQALAYVYFEDEPGVTVAP